MILQVRDLGFDYGRKPVLSDVSFDLAPGVLLGLVGPNGAGKSTLLRCLHGALRARKGSVQLDGKELDTYSRKEIARIVGVVPQQCEVLFPVSVRHFVGLGRFAHERWLGGASSADVRVVSACLAELGLELLADRPVNELSGGEFRRVLIAQALAQDPRLLLFDEPVQQLDLLHQLEVMEFARAFTRRENRAAVVVLHDLTLAARYCDQLALLQRGRVVTLGTPEAVLTEAQVRNVWDVTVAVERHAATGTLVVVPLTRSGTSDNREIDTEDRS